MFRHSSKSEERAVSSRNIRRVNVFTHLRPPVLGRCWLSLCEGHAWLGGRVQSLERDLQDRSMRLVVGDSAEPCSCGRRVDSCTVGMFEVA